MKGIMESVTYLVTTMAMFSLLTSFRMLWMHLSPVFMYVIVVCIAVLFYMYISKIRSRDGEWIFKVIYIFGVPLLFSALIYKDFLNVLFVTVVSAMAGISAYFNYYRMVDYIYDRHVSGEIVINPDKWGLNSNAVDIVDYVGSANDFLSALKKLKGEINAGNVIICEEGDRTVVKVIK